MEGELIPGLPHEVARECLLRVPFDALRTVQAVCKLWKHDVDTPSFHSLRKSAGLARPVVALALSEPAPAPANNKNSSPSPLLYHLALFEPATGAWTSPPPIPGLPRGLPLFCQMAAVGRELVVVGGWDPRTWAATDEVHVYDLVAGSWRRGARMPGPQRSFFACAASESLRAVFVAGGNDESKNALRSALAYDVSADAWVQLPDMARQRDECRGVFAGGAFCVVGEYPTEAQGQFSRSAEAFDVAAWRWGAVEEDGESLRDVACPRTCVTGGGHGRVYVCDQAGQVAVMEEGAGEWKRLAELPQEVRAALQMVAWEEGLMVLGSGGHHGGRGGGAQVGYVLEMAGSEEKGMIEWRKVELPREYSGNVQAACCFHL